PALAQSARLPVDRTIPRYDPRAGFEVGRPARDGCVNVPGIPHNSADCMRIPKNDYNTVMNTPSTDLSGRPTGATENAERNRRIISGQSLN
ncbi:MAG: hypothetical protein JO256_14625, partial [Alphaproteobacteria bacterium]|nr:hypothetical protein [Alphaproteobacteria bacterium]